MIKEILTPPVCSGCGTSLVYDKFQKTHKNKLQLQWYGVDPELSKCTTCGQLTDIIARKSEDYKHAIYHKQGSDPTGATFTVIIFGD